jgi:hypothetical protein
MITAIIAGRRRRRLPVVDMMMSSVRRAKSNAKSKKIEVRVMRGPRMMRERQQKRYGF